MTSQHWNAFRITDPLWWESAEYLCRKWRSFRQNDDIFVAMTLSLRKHAYLLFWYHVFTWVSVRFSRAASSILSWTLKYFCLSKLDSSELSWWSVKAVRAFRGFLGFRLDDWSPPSPPGLDGVPLKSLLFSSRSSARKSLVISLLCFEILSWSNSVLERELKSPRNLACSALGLNPGRCQHPPCTHRARHLTDCITGPLAKIKVMQVYESEYHKLILSKVPFENITIPIRKYM